MANGALQLSEEFLQDYKQFAAKYDKIFVDKFAGEQLESLCKDFFAKYSKYIRSFPFSSNFKFPDCDYNASMEEDLRILSSPVTKDVEQTDYKSVLSKIYWRAAGACYLRVTLHKSKLNQEDNRREIVDLTRYALRYTASNFETVNWYMIAIGYHCDGISASNPKERTLNARLFHLAIKRAIEIGPDQPLGHHLLGRYYYNVSTLNWFERTAANTLLGAKMEGSYEDAEKQFIKAHELHEPWLPTGLWMAKTLIALKRPKDSIKYWIEFGLAQDVKEPTTEVEKRELLQLGADLKLDK